MPAKQNSQRVDRMRIAFPVPDMKCALPPLPDAVPQNAILDPVCGKLLAKGKLAPGSDVEFFCTRCKEPRRFRIL